jgi:transposase
MRSPKVRHRVTWELRERRGRKLDPEWANRRRLLRARERLSDKSFTKMWNAIVDGVDTGQILSAWIAKEELRTLLSTVRVGGDAHLIRHRLHRFLSWWPEINAVIQTGITNARAEGDNRLVKQVKRVACGFETETTRPAGYDSSAPANSGPQPKLDADCPVKIEEPENDTAAATSQNRKSVATTA